MQRWSSRARAAARQGGARSKARRAREPRLAAAEVPFERGSSTTAALTPTGAAARARMEGQKDRESGLTREAFRAGNRDVFAWSVRLGARPVGGGTRGVRRTSRLASVGRGRSRQSQLDARTARRSEGEAAGRGAAKDKPHGPLRSTHGPNEARKAAWPSFCMHFESQRPPPSLRERRRPRARLVLQGR